MPFVRYVPEEALNELRAKERADREARFGSVFSPERPHTDDELARLVARRRFYGVHGVAFEGADQPADVAPQDVVGVPDRQVEQAFEEGHALGQVEDRVPHPADGRGQVVVGFAQSVTSAFRRWLRACFLFRHHDFSFLGRGVDPLPGDSLSPGSTSLAGGSGPVTCQDSPPIRIQEVRP